MAWAFCRMAHQYKNLGEALRDVLSLDIIIPTTLDNCKLNPRLYCGNSRSVDETNFMKIFDGRDKTELYVFADTNAGLDGCAFFMNDAGFLSVQSKIRVSFDIVEALNRYYSRLNIIIYLVQYQSIPFILCP